MSYSRFSTRKIRAKKLARRVKRNVIYWMANPHKDNTLLMGRRRVSTGLYPVPRGGKTNET
ncbi:hypothetical protein LCGC14_0600820 [marine sediment metagenome]|uniref:Uncharacterized protein n=1 Tax=marine sediment metagenome TaxID=412755 RepID=A0A0F9TWP3_9ZZZZ